jgi:hypothetical protein
MHSSIYSSPWFHKAIFHCYFQSSFTCHLLWYLNDKSHANSTFVYLHGEHMLSLGVTLPLPSLELAKSVYKILKAPDFHDLDNLGDPMNTLDHGEILLTCFLQSRLGAKNPWQFAIRIPLVKAEVILPDRKHAKLCKKSCVCAEQNLTCTDLCSCQGSESCKNVHSYTLAEDV